MNDAEVKEEVKEQPADASAPNEAAVEANAASEDAGEEILEQVAPEELPALLQALLLASGDPLSLDRLCAASKFDEDAVTAALRTVHERCTDDLSGFELAEVAGQYQLRTRSRFAPFIRQLKAGKPRRLSTAALETLAIIAYRQPIVKSDVEGIRGVDCTPTLKTLLERRLVRIVGHQPTIGQPALYGTTDEFLKLFGLPSLGALPTLRELKEIDREPGEPEPEAQAANSAAQETKPIEQAPAN